ncbi:MAG: 4Fe-4S dicluster domain-containing protein [Bacteroidales bacterium]|nr:4Fe-4S dicluster domain-containing protein [Bacteroidales bacterium]
MNILTINHQSCQRCGVCIATCPVSVISLDAENFPYMKEEDEKRCVLCGHCEAVCSKQALRHYLLPQMKMVQRDKLQEINAENLSEYFRNRRSIRVFLPKPIDKSVLEKIFEVVSYSPTGVNLQKNKWIMICDHHFIRQLSNAVINWMKTMIEQKAELAQYLNFQKLVNAFEQGNDIICRSAMNLVIGYTDALHTGGAIDSIIATSQLELLLPSFKLGGCWAGYLMIALRYSPDIKKMIGLDESHTVHSAMMIGYPKYHYYKTPYRKKAEVKWI